MQNKGQKQYCFEDLIDVMKALRTPVTGCPWDLEQDFASIAPYTIEEAYEVADAIQRNDMVNLREELGDLLLQPIYHAQMATESNIFDIHDVVHDITAKMISRHPHVFSDKDANSASDVNKIWEERKDAEQKQPGTSALDGVPLALPALLRAQKLQKKAAKTGFEWTQEEQILDKLEEELGELRAACKNNRIQEKAEEIGDVLFVIANLARIMEINAEEALRQTNEKFIRRFKGMEEDFQARGERLKDAPLNVMQECWNAQKQKERKTGA